MKKYHWILTADLHGALPTELAAPLKGGKILDNEPTRVIVLGDVGCNYHGEGDRRDEYMKQRMQESGNIFYLIRGNHEFAPQHLSTIEIADDEAVGGKVWIEPKYPNIRYFDPYGLYEINGLTVGVVSGAYSVDKEYRLLRGWNWFDDEQLDQEAMEDCYDMFMNKGGRVDLILSHTCPYDLRPIDMFLPYIDQSKVDNTMEYFLQEIADSHPEAAWCWGHFHADRQIGKHRMIYRDLVSLEDIIKGIDN